MLLSSILPYIFNSLIKLNSHADCGIIPMTEWAGEVTHQQGTLQQPVKIVIIQHTVTPEGNTEDECTNIVKGIRKYHIETLHFDDIGESFLICGNGKVYEGSGWSRVGSHTKGYNSKSIGISFIGNFMKKLPTPEARTAAKGLISCGVSNNHLAADYQLVGHRQVSNTLSPGDKLQEEIQSWFHYTSLMFKFYNKTSSTS